MGGCNQNGSKGDWLGVGEDKTGSVYGPVVGCGDYDDEPSGSSATELVLHQFFFHCNNFKTTNFFP